MKIYEALAQDFAAEGADAQFCLVGDGNMHFSHALQGLGAETYHARHEHCAAAMAMGHWSATGKVGVASVTCGPGFTQTMTALAAAVRSRVPLIIFVGEVPLGAKWHSQVIDQQPFAAACGAHYIAAHSAARMHQYVREAFYVARFQRTAVVLGVPYDLQQQTMPDAPAYQSSQASLPPKPLIAPDPAQVAEVAGKLGAARCPVIVAGRGVFQSGATELVEELAERTGALLGTTLQARGLYDHNPFSLGVMGGFARAVARDIGRQADLVVAFGASLTQYTMESGQMFPAAEIVQVDVEPLGLKHGMRYADYYLTADARLTAAALLDKLAIAAPSTAIRSPALARRIAEEPADPTPYPIEEGTVDPRLVFEELERVIPHDYDMLPGDGHQCYFHSTMRGFDPRKYHSMTGFGAIGSDISYAIGVAAARKSGRVVLFEGDGSLLMHIQELEAIARHRLKLLIVVCNDGAYGSEIHKLRADGIDDSIAIFGRTDLAAIARGFGLRGTNVTDIAQLAPLMRAYEAQDVAELWNVHISDQVVSPMMRSGLRARGADAQK